MVSSVISSSSRSAGTPSRSSVSATSSGRFTSRRSRPLTLTATATSSPASRQARHWRTDASSTIRVSGRIRPVCSASGRKTSGVSSPRVGCCQRTSASARTMWPVRRSACGWKWTTSSLFDDDGAAEIGDEREALRRVVVLLLACTRTGRALPSRGRARRRPDGAACRRRRRARGRPRCRRWRRSRGRSPSRCSDVRARRAACRRARKRPSASVSRRDDGELVTAEARDGVGLAHGLRRAPLPTCSSRWSPLW